MATHRQLSRPRRDGSVVLLEVVLLLGWLKAGFTTGALIVVDALPPESRGVISQRSSDDVASPTVDRPIASEAPIVWLLPPASGLSTLSLAATRAHVTGVTTIEEVRHLMGDNARASISVASQAAQDLHARAVLFVLQPEPERAELYLYDAGGGRLWMRELPRESQGEELWAESLGLVAASAVRALVGGQPMGMERVVFEDPAPPEPAPSPAATKDQTKGVPGSSAAVFMLSVGYRGGSLSRSHPWTHGVDVGAEVTLRNGVAILAGYEVLWPARVGFNENSITLARHPVRAGVGFRWSFPSLYIRPALMLAIDIVRRASSTTDPALQAVAPRTFVDAGLVPAIEAGFALSRHVHVFIEIRTEFWMEQRTYSIATPEEVVLLRPFRARPTLRAGLGASFPGIPRRRGRQKN